MMMSSTCSKGSLKEEYLKDNLKLGPAPAPFNASNILPGKIVFFIYQQKVKTDLDFENFTADLFCSPRNQSSIKMRCGEILELLSVRLSIRLTVMEMVVCTCLRNGCVQFKLFFESSPRSYFKDWAGFVVDGRVKHTSVYANQHLDQVVPQLAGPGLLLLSLTEVEIALQNYLGLAQKPNLKNFNLKNMNHINNCLIEYFFAHSCLYKGEQMPSLRSRQSLLEPKVYDKPLTRIKIYKIGNQPTENLKDHYITFNNVKDGIAKPSDECLNLKTSLSKAQTLKKDTSRRVKEEIDCPCEKSHYSSPGSPKKLVKPAGSEEVNGQLAYTLKLLGAWGSDEEEIMFAVAGLSVVCFDIERYETYHFMFLNSYLPLYVNLIFSLQLDQTL